MPAHFSAEGQACCLLRGNPRREGCGGDRPQRAAAHRQPHASASVFMSLTAGASLEPKEDECTK